MRDGGGLAVRNGHLQPALHKCRPLNVAVRPSGRPLVCGVRKSTASAVPPPVPRIYELATPCKATISHPNLERALEQPWASAWAGAQAPAPQDAPPRRCRSGIQHALKRENLFFKSAVAGYTLGGYINLSHCTVLMVGVNCSVCFECGTANADAVCKFIFRVGRHRCVPETMLNH